MDGEELAALYEVQREIGDIFTSMKRNGTEESEAHKEASLNLEKSAQMVSQLNDFIEKYGSDTLEESDALAAAVVAEAEYINTLKGKIEDAENESNTINMAYSHIDLSEKDYDDGEGEGIDAEIECKLAAMKYLLNEYPSPDYHVEDVSTEYGVYYNHLDGSAAARWEAVFLIQGEDNIKNKNSNNILFFVDMGSGKEDTKSRLDAIEERLQRTCELMVSTAPIGSLPLITFTKHMTIMGARELGYLVAKGCSKPQNPSVAGSSEVVTRAMLIKNVRLMVVGDKGDSKLSNSIRKKGHFFLEKTVFDAPIEANETSEGEDGEGAMEVAFRVVLPNSK